MTAQSKKNETLRALDLAAKRNRCKHILIAYAYIGKAPTPLTMKIQSADIQYFIALVENDRDKMDYRGRSPHAKEIEQLFKDTYERDIAALMKELYNESDKT